MAYSIDDKRRILQTLFPKAVLKAVTPSTLFAIPAGLAVDGMVVIHSLPFRVGRESRVVLIDGKVHRIERSRTNDDKGINDLYLMDGGELLQISREHFSIEATADGGFRVVDRGSKCGLTVAGKRIGAKSGVGSAPLHDGDLIVIGTAESAYQFVFITGFDSVV